MDDELDLYYFKSIYDFLIIFNCNAIKNLNDYRYSFH